MMIWWGEKKRREKKKKRTLTLILTTTVAFNRPKKGPKRRSGKTWNLYNNVYLLFDSYRTSRLILSTRKTNPPAVWQMSEKDDTFEIIGLSFSKDNKRNFLFLDRILFHFSRHPLGTILILCQLLKYQRDLGFQQTWYQSPQLCLKLVISPTRGR